jgi:purine-nucleoside phosphorylase
MLTATSNSQVNFSSGDSLDGEHGGGDLERALAAIRRRWRCAATTAVVLGSGLGDLADDIDAEAALPYAEIPGFANSTALSHKGRLVCGALAGQPVIVMQGRCHLYEGRTVAEATFPVRVLAALGVKTLILTNAAGGINPRFARGDVMVIDDHINLMFSMGRVFPDGAHYPDGRKDAFPTSRPCRYYDEDLAALAAACARRNGFDLQRGVYVGVTGPCYETRAEYRAFRRIGGDCVGMSTIPEVLAAAAVGLRVAAFSTITNVACPDVPRHVSAGEVIEVAGGRFPRSGRSSPACSRGKASPPPQVRGPDAPAARSRQYGLPGRCLPEAA